MKSLAGLLCARKVALLQCVLEQAEDRFTHHILLILVHVPRELSYVTRLAGSELR